YESVLGGVYGRYTLTMAEREMVVRVWSVYVNRSSMDMYDRNAKTAGIDRVRPVHHDEVPSGIRFAAIWSNPAIRIGKQALHDMLTHWLDRLQPGAAAHLVVQRHLGADSLQRWLSQQGRDRKSVV